MEIFSDFKTIDDEPIELPPGFRFHPTDEELITHYLSPKVLDNTFSTKAVGDVDLNKVEPWDLPWKAKMGEKEWYFFCVRDRKYPTGLRANRATDAGYWKATGKDKEIHRAKILMGIKKTLVFYRGRAPRGVKSNWVMHEYRLEGNHSMHNIPKPKNEWVICRIFKKSSGGKKVHISGLLRSTNCGTGSQSSDLPPLMNLSSDENQSKTNLSAEGSYIENPSTNDFNSSLSNCNYTPFSLVLPKDSTPSSCFSNHIVPFTENAYGYDSVLMQDQSILRILLEKQSIKAEYSLDTNMNDNIFSGREVGFNYSEDQEFPIISTGPVELDYLWNY